MKTGQVVGEGWSRHRQKPITLSQCTHPCRFRRLPRTRTRDGSLRGQSKSRLMAGSRAPCRPAAMGPQAVGPLLIDVAKKADPLIAMSSLKSVPVGGVPF